MHNAWITVTLFGAEKIFTVPNFRNLKIIGNLHAGTVACGPITGIL